MQKKLSNKELVAAGHQFAANLSADTPLIDMAKMVSQLATQLDAALTAAGEVCKQRDALLAENVVSRKAVQTFCDVVGGNTHAICEEVGADGIRAILVAMNATGNMPATDAALNAVRAEGIHFAANRMLAAWDSGFIDDTPAQAYDISGAVLSAVEFLPDASPEDFKRDFADSIRAEIAAKPRAENDTTPSQYESLAGGK